MKIVAHFVISQETKGVVLTEKQFETLQSAWMSQNVTEWEGKRVRIRNFTDDHSYKLDLHDVDIEMEIMP